MVQAFELNIEWLKSQFFQETIILNADTENKLPGLIHRRFRQSWLGDLLVATGHKISFKTGKAIHNRKATP